MGKTVSHHGSTRILTPAIGRGYKTYVDEELVFLLSQLKCALVTAGAATCSSKPAPTKNTFTLRTKRTIATVEGSKHHAMRKNARAAKKKKPPGTRTKTAGTKRTRSHCAESLRLQASHGLNRGRSGLVHGHITNTGSIQLTPGLALELHVGLRNNVRC